MLIDSSAALAQRRSGNALAAARALPESGGTRRVPVLPVLPALGGLLPWGGLQRGSTIEVGTAGNRSGAPATTAMSLMLALLAEPSRTGSWCAFVGMPDLGLAAAREAGVELSRLALVPAPGNDWAAVVAALVDGFDVVVVRPPANLFADGRRLVARVRYRGAVLVSVGGWPGAEVQLTATARSWEGAGDDGHGHLTARRVTVRAEGRGAAARPREAALWLPAPRSEGTSVAEPVCTPALHPVDQQHPVEQQVV